MPMPYCSSFDTNENQLLIEIQYLVRKMICYQIKYMKIVTNYIFIAFDKYSSY